MSAPVSVFIQYCDRTLLCGWHRPGAISSVGAPGSLDLTARQVLEEYDLLSYRPTHMNTFSLCLPRPRYLTACFAPHAIATLA